MNSNTINLVLVDAQAIFRVGVRHLVAALPDLAVVGETGSCSDAFALCERLRPHVLLCDVAMPGSLPLLHRLAERRYETRVVILTERLDRDLLRQGLQAGAVGYLLKQIEPFDFAQALRSAAAGRLVFAPEVSAASLCEPRQADYSMSPFSAREQAVIDLLLLGLPNQAIAAELHLSCATVKFHLRNIYAKLGVTSRAEAMAACFQMRRIPTLINSRRKQGVA
ncbi:MAG: LuxR C-terminal-related transcriptional regulator [Oscillochloridaceae bacterium umkhey_bin13]